MQKYRMRKTEHSCHAYSVYLFNFAWLNCKWRQINKSISNPIKPHTAVPHCSRLWLLFLQPFLSQTNTHAYSDTKILAKMHGFRCHLTGQSGLFGITLSLVMVQVTNISAWPGCFIGVRFELQKTHTCTHIWKRWTSTKCLKGTKASY